MDPKRGAIRKPDTLRNGSEQSPARSSQQLDLKDQRGTAENIRGTIRRSHEGFGHRQHGGYPKALSK